MFGYMRAELEENFAEYMDAVVRGGRRDRWDRVMDLQGLIPQLKLWYDGFCFSAGAGTVYNPVSIGKFFYNKGEFANYWFETGTPAFLLKLLTRKRMFLTDMVEAGMSADSLATFNLADLAGREVSSERVVQMLFQTGYLTLDSLLEMAVCAALPCAFPMRRCGLLSRSDCLRPMNGSPSLIPMLSSWSKPLCPATRSR